MPTGTPIIATRAGTVTQSGWNDGYGYHVCVNHGGGVMSCYAHLLRTNVFVGEYVGQGQTVGYADSTGWSTGTHLHFEIIVNGTPRNPANYVRF